jgi:hypothetical protein
MIKTRRQDDVSGLPEPIALTPDQLKETAGGLTIIIHIGGPGPVMPPIRAGGIPAPKVMM